jgi:hypothetical protein
MVGICDSEQWNGGVKCDVKWGRAEIFDENFLDRSLA